MDVPVFSKPQSVTIATVVPVTAAQEETTSSGTNIFWQFSIFYTFSNLFDANVAFQIQLETIKVGREVNSRQGSSTALGISNSNLPFLQAGKSRHEFSVGSSWTYKF